MNSQPEVIQIRLKRGKNMYCHHTVIRPKLKLIIARNYSVAEKPVGSVQEGAVESLRVAKISFNHPGVQPTGLCSPEWLDLPQCAERPRPVYFLTKNAASISHCSVNR